MPGALSLPWPAVPAQEMLAVVTGITHDPSLCQSSTTAQSAGTVQSPSRTGLKLPVQPPLIKAAPPIYSALK